MKLHELHFQPGAYLALELSSSSRSMLIKKFPPKFSRQICHHVTIERRLSESKLNVIKKLLGESPVASITGYLEGDGVECFSVEINGDNKRPDGLFYHVTHSVEPPHKPVESNGLLVAAHGIPQTQLQVLFLTGAYRLIKG